MVISTHNCQTPCVPFELGRKLPEIIPWLIINPSSRGSSSTSWCCVLSSTISLRVWFQAKLFDFQQTDWLTDIDMAEGCSNTTIGSKKLTDGHLQKRKFLKGGQLYFPVTAGVVKLGYLQERLLKVMLERPKSLTSLWLGVKRKKETYRTVSREFPWHH